MSDTLLRNLIILQSLPIYPSKITSRNLLEFLNRKGVHASIRMVQRDLEKLKSMNIFGIDADKSSKPIGWYLLRNTPKLKDPHININNLKLIEQKSKAIETPDFEKICRTNHNEIFKRNITIELETNSEALQDILFYPIGSDQKVASCRHNKFKIIAKTDDTLDLRCRILSFGSSVKVIQPNSLSSFVYQEGKKIVNTYSHLE